VLGDFLDVDTDRTPVTAPPPEPAATGLPQRLQLAW